MIGQRNRRRWISAALRRLLATTAYLRPGCSRSTIGPQLNQRRFLPRALVGGTWPANEWWSHPRRPSPRPDTPRVVREPESAWWEQHDDGDVAMTVAVVDETDTPGSAQAIVSRLAELAVHDELLVVYGSGARSKPGHRAVLAGLRGHLPRHHLITMHVDHDHGGLRRDAAAALEQFMEDGSLPVVVTQAAAVAGVTAEISSYLHPDRVLQVDGTTSGADLQQVWRCRATADVSY